MPNEQLLAELQSQSINLAPESVDLAQKVNTLAGAWMPDSTRTRDLYLWKDPTSKRPADWFRLMTELRPADRIQVHTTVGDIFRAFKKEHHLLPQGVLGEIRDLSVAQLLTLPRIGEKRVGFLKLAFDRTELEEDEFTLSEMPSKRILEDYIRTLMGKPPLSDRSPVFNFETRRIER